MVQTSLVNVVDPIYTSGWSPWSNFSATRRASYTQHDRLKNTARFAFYRANGYLPINAYDFFKQEISHNRCHTVTTWNQYGTMVNQIHHDHHFCFLPDGSNSIYDTSFDSARAQAIARANGKVREQSMSVFETFYEGKKTTNMILNSIRTVTSAVRNVKRGRFLQAARDLGLKSVPNKVSRKRTLSGNWLEFRYGWMPLYYTVYGTMEFTYNQMRTSQPIYHVKARSSIPKKRFSYGNSNRGVGYGNTSGDCSNCYYRYSTSSSSELEGFVDIGYTFRVTNPTLVASTSLGLTNPLLVAWELVPLSFVADWFVNVSDVLAQLDAWTGRTYLAGYETRKAVETRTTFSKLEQQYAPYAVKEFTPARTVSKNIRFKRISLTSPPTLGLQFNIGLNTKRIIDAVSLLRQFTRK